jgi:hypothetical protein
VVLGRHGLERNDGRGLGRAIFAVVMTDRSG